jgi:transposase-like protein
VGTVDVAVPKLRQESYFPEWLLERRKRAESALISVVETSEAWNTFFADLVARGLQGVLLVTSDAHAGLVEAIAANLPGASWQRCRTHYAANLMAVCPKSAWLAVKAMLHSVYDQPDAEAVHTQFDKLLDQLTEKLEPAAWVRLAETPRPARRRPGNRLVGRARRPRPMARRHRRMEAPRCSACGAHRRSGP